MRSTFFGLETARRALFTQQSALHTTPHNVANAKTEGYSRQRVNFEAETPWPAGGMNRPELPGQMGTGVKAGDITRIRDSFLDLQFRNENSKAGYWESKAEALRRMEDVMNEPSDEGLSKVMNRFWSSLQDVATNPEDEGARKVAAQRAVAVADTLNYLHNTLSGVQDEIDYQLETEVDEVNSLLRQINDLNQQIGEVEPHGYLPNDLYDQRDVLIDRLSQKLDIEVGTEPSGGNAKDIAMGKTTISFTLADGTKQTLIGKDGELNGLAVNGGEFSVGTMDEDGKVAAGATFELTAVGSLRGLKESSEFYGEQLTDLDKMANAFKEAFNTQHTQGTDLNGDAGGDFFTGNGAADLAVSDVILNDVSKIAASLDGFPGNGDNAIKLAKVKDQPIAGLDDRSVQEFYEGMVGELGVQAQEANRLKNNSEVLKNSVNANRQSVSGVSLDEEMSNLIQFQHAYNAAARSMTVVDEMLDRIINQMGVVGR